MVGGRNMSLKARLQQSNILVAPGVYDGLTAAIATDAGFETLYLSGAGVAYTRLGRPDIGLSTSSEMADTMALIADRTALPVIIDADTGFGNALKLKVGDVAAPNFIGRHARLFGDDAGGELFGGHFEREEANNPAFNRSFGAIGKAAPFVGFRDVESHVGGERGFAH